FLLGDSLLEPCQDSGEETLHLVRPGLAFGRVLDATITQGLFKLTQQFLLLFVQTYRGLNLNVAVQVTGVAGAQALDTLAAQAECLAHLGAFRDGDFATPCQGRHFHRSAQGRRGKGDGQLAMQVLAITLENTVRLDADFHIQVTGRTTVHARLAIATGADAHAIINTGWNLDLQSLGLFDLAFAVTHHAGIRNFLAATVTGRAGLLHAENALLHAHCATALAGTAGLCRGTGLGTRTRAGFAVFPAGYANFSIKTGCCLLQADIQRIAQVRATVNLRATAATSAAAIKDFAKNIAKGVCKSGPAHAATNTAHASVGID